MNILQRLRTGNTLYSNHKVYFWEDHSGRLYTLINSCTNIKRTRIIYKVKERNEYNK